jgi:hypothetical protein
MWLQIGVIFGLFSLWVLTAYLANKAGSKSAQLESIKAEIKRQEKERERAEKIANSIDNMDDTTVRNKLHEIANKQ